jgi:phenylacetate-coenzyme A ligase PaaK-like adenylate-forming protein
MQPIPPERIFSQHTDQEFNDLCLEIFHYQYRNNKLYRQYVDALKVDPKWIRSPEQIPFLPIDFFKTHSVLCGEEASVDVTFKSSGTTGAVTSKHRVQDLEYYDVSLNRGFRLFYGEPEQYLMVALLPSYVERKNVSLVYMANQLIRATGHRKSGFYPADPENLDPLLQTADRKVFLLGVTFALLDLSESMTLQNPNVIIMETGGMKGRRKELVREEVHMRIRKAFRVKTIHSEYGMTELLSQAYSSGEGIYRAPPWMKVFVRDVNDPLSLIGSHKTGGLNIIDLANVNSCAFIATQDLGRTHKDGSFEVLGRFDHSDIRGCNLMVE